VECRLCTDKVIKIWNPQAGRIAEEVKRRNDRTKDATRSIYGRTSTGINYDDPNNLVYSKEDKKYLQERQIKKEKINNTPSQ